MTERHMDTNVLKATYLTAYQNDPDNRQFMKLMSEIAAIYGFLKPDQQAAFQQRADQHFNEWVLRQRRDTFETYQSVMFQMDSILGVK